MISDARIGYLRIITRIPVQAMLDLRHDSPAERFRMARRSGTLLLIGCCAFLAAPAAASAAKPWPEGGVSARYQAVSCDTAASVELARNRVAAPGVIYRPYPRISAFYLGIPPRERRSTLSRYQSREAISNNQKIVSSSFLLHPTRFTSTTCVQTSGEIPIHVAKRISAAEAGFLLRLAVALAAVYVLFLAVWFWATRDRRSRVGSAVRS
jgi:hypothetical protein